MKAFPIIKVLTGVTVLFFTCLSLGAEVNRAQCNLKCDTEAKSSCTKPAAGADNDATNKYNQCVRDAKQSCIDRDGCGELESARDIKNSCEQAFEKYSDLSAKEKEACSAFDKAGGTNCKAKADSCNKKISSLSNPFGTTSGEEPEGKENGYGALSEIANLYVNVESMKNPNQSQTASIAAGGGACVKSIDRKARAQDKKDKDAKRRELLDKITKQKEDILKYKEDLDKERDKNLKESNEVKAENKKDVNAKEKSITEETSKVSKQLIDIGKQLRARNLTITKKMQELARVNFEYQTKMLALADDKVNMKCKQEFETLKAGLVNARLGAASGGSAEEQKQQAALAALAAQYKAKGIRGSGEMKAMLIATRKACYESANTARNQAKLANSQDVKNIQDAIDEEKTNMKEDKNAIVTAQKDLENFKKQIETEKQTAESEMAGKLDALSKDLANQIENTTSKTNVANQKIQELTAEINKLVLVENFEVEDAYSEAIEAIEKGKAGRDRAFEACDCANKGTKGLDSYCSRLNDDKKSYDGTRTKKTPTKTSN